jgi:hypothetical protein
MAFEVQYNVSAIRVIGSRESPEKHTMAVSNSTVAERTKWGRYGKLI